MTARLYRGLHAIGSEFQLVSGPDLPNEDRTPAEFKATQINVIPPSALG
jgi:hypothetical protein